VMALMDVKLRYQNSVLGFLWSFLRPMLQFFVYYTVFGVIFSMSSTPNFALKLFFGVLVWSWFSEGTSLGLQAFISKKSIITKIKTNRLLPPAAGLMTATINFFLNLCVFFSMYFLFGLESPVEDGLTNRVWMFIFAFLNIFILIGSVNIILANLNVFFRDMQMLWELALTYGIFLTPVIYVIPIPECYQPLYYGTVLLSLPFEIMKASVFGGSVIVYDRPEIWGYYGGAMLLLVGMAYYCHVRFSKNVADYL